VGGKGAIAPHDNSDILPLVEVYPARALADIP